MYTSLDPSDGMRTLARLGYAMVFQIFESLYRPSRLRASLPYLAGAGLAGTADKKLGMVDALRSLRRKGRSLLDRQVAEGYKLGCQLGRQLLN